jgi:spore maturation protein CgeB/glycosyltransferase involved in cell wall biosynthesis
MLDILSLSNELQKIKGELQLIKRKYKIQPTARFPELNISSLKELRMACIMDEFTFLSYSPECEVKQLKPENWQQELEKFRPHLLFVESAWQGLDNAWYKKVSNPSPELIELVQWCKDKNIPTVFWNKEDPVHFATFIKTARFFNYVFTTDIDCVEKYKGRLNHNNVYFLPFAVQPRLHNPLEEFQREEKMCFAGAYYHRYTERNKNFATICNVALKRSGLVIYDRNYGKDISEIYRFPEEFRSYIAGSLPAESISKAYKGFKYGINMNSVKESQTMFARRVFELLASNTVVVSNYARGLKNMLGDLVIATDDAQVLENNLEWVKNDTNYRRFRLLGLRKVLTEHTYYERLRYIVNKVFKRDYPYTEEGVFVVSKVHTLEQLKNVIISYNCQFYKHKKLLIIAAEDLDLPGKDGHLYDFVVNINEIRDRKIEEIFRGGYVAYFSPHDYYGPHYLTDFALAPRFAEADVIGKKTFYNFEYGDVKLCNSDRQYKYTDEIDCRCAVIKTSLLQGTVGDFLEGIETKKFSYAGNCLSLDEFNYCRNGINVSDKESFNDICLKDQGISITKILETAEKIEPLTCIATATYTLSAGEIAQNLNGFRSGSINVSYEEGRLYIDACLPEDRHEYSYFKKIYPVNQLATNGNMKIFLDSEGILDVRLVAEFLTEEGKKIAPVFCPTQSFLNNAIPDDTKKVRLGFRVKGSGQAVIKAAVFGEPEESRVYLPKSETMMLTKGYPAYHDLYKYAFIHSRLREYKKQGLLVDVFCLKSILGKVFREFEGIDVVEGNGKAVNHTLINGKYVNILVHFLDEELWQLLQPVLDNTRVIIWIHGSEIQPWYRREFNYKDQAEKQRAITISDKRVAFWKEIFSQPHPNLHFVFVSKYFADEVFEDIGIRLPESNYSIIHNYINTELFNYVPKNSEQRKKILSIRPFASRTYANDLTVKAILELSSRPFFEELEFLIIGDGVLFEETVEPLRQFSNVKLRKAFLRQEEIAALHKEYGVFLVPSRMDSQGVSRDEAMSSGLVPITNRVAAIPEFVDEGSGMLVEAEDYTGMARCIEELYYSPEKFRNLSENAAKRVRRQCGFEKTILKELALFNKQT